MLWTITTDLNIMNFTVANTITPERNKPASLTLHRLKKNNFLYRMIRLKVQNRMEMFSEYHLQNTVKFIILRSVVIVQSIYELCSYETKLWTTLYHQKILACLIETRVGIFKLSFFRELLDTLYVVDHM